MFDLCEKSTLKQIQFFPLRNLFLVLTQECQSFKRSYYSDFRSIICQVVAFGRLKTKGSLEIDKQPGLNILNQLKHSLAEN